MLITVIYSFAQDPQDVQAYIDKYKNLAVREQIRVGIPAAVTLAQGIHESAAGKSELATLGNNHFGIKCKSNWEGETMAHDDDAKQECFRKYPSSEHSYIDHSDYLKASNRYHFLFDLELTDYHGWTSGLKRAGYATNPAYVKRLDDVIEKYNLQQYTYEGIQQANKTTGEIIPENDKPVSDPKPTSSLPVANNGDPKTYYKGLKGFWAQKDEQLLNKANEKNIRYAKLLALNDLDDAPLENDMFIFIEKKRKIGTEEFHTVQQNENMHLIAQKEAIQLEQLLIYNNLLDGQEPEVGEKIYLQYQAPKAPQMKNKFLSALPEEKRIEKQIANTQETSRAEIIEPAPVVVEEKVVEKQPEIVQEIKEEITYPLETKVAETKEVSPVVMEEVKQTSPEPIVASIDPPAIQQEPETKIDASTASIPVNSIQTPTQPDIIDAEKAKKIDDLLNSAPIDGSAPKTALVIPETKSPEVVQVNEVKQTEVIVAEKQVAVVAEVKEPEVIQTIPAQQPQREERSYNEKNVSDSVKNLKKKFDRIVYAPKPPKKVDTIKKVEAPAPKPIAPVVKKEIPPVPKKTVADKNTNTTDAKKKTDTSKKEVENKKSNVEVTPNGIKRDLKKDNAKTNEAKDNKSTDKKNENKSSKDKKETLKKETTKKETAKKETGKAEPKNTKKEVSTKDKKTASEKDKKDTKKKTTSKK